MNRQLNEDSLLAGDLVNLVNRIFEIDHYSSKMGKDNDVVVLSFTVNGKDPANDLVGFIEKGYKFVLDADTTPGELEDGKYRVFVELERSKAVVSQICNLLNGIKRLTNIKEFKFRYHKSFTTVLATEENLKKAVPNNPRTYAQELESRKKFSLESFFSKAALDKFVIEGNMLKVKKIYSDPLVFKILDGGRTSEVMGLIKESIDVNNWAEIIFLTKYFGDYEITKYGKKLVFESQGQSIVLERLW